MSFDRIPDSVKLALVPAGGVAERAVKSGFWITLLNVVDRLLRLAMVIVLARILVPAEFGLMGIALLTVAAVRQFSRLGIDAALIQHERTDVDGYLNTAWTVKAVRGVGIAAVTFLLAPSVAAFFGEPRAAPVIRVIALSPLIAGLQNPGVMYLQKQLEFHRQFVFTLSSTVANVAVAVGAAVALQNVWALVYGSLAGSVVTVLVSFLIHGYRPRPAFDREKAAELLGYGKWIFGSGVLLFLLNQGDDAIVGWLLGAGALGFYQIAYRFSNAPATEVTHTISRVVFPTYSQIQADTEKLRIGYFRTLHVVSAVTFPMATGIILVAPAFVRTFLGEQWVPMVLAMQLLAVWGGVRALGATIGPLFRAIGRPDLDTKLHLAKLVLVAVAIYPATVRWGIDGAALVIVVASIVLVPPTLWLAMDAIEGTGRQFGRILFYPALGSGLMALAVLAIERTTAFGPTPVGFVVLVLTGVIVYLSVVLVMVRWLDYDLTSTLRSAVEAVS